MNAHRRHRHTLPLPLLLGVAPFALALVGSRVPTGHQGGTLPSIRALGRRLAVSTDTLGNVVGIRQLGDGRVIVNDAGRRRLLLFDSTLSHAVVIADSTSTTKKAYGAGQGGIIAYRGDTTLFVDPLALSMLVIDPHGAIVRSVAAPRPADAPVLAMPLGNAAADAAGRVIYRDVKMFCAGPMGCVAILGQMGPTLDATAPTAPALPSYTVHDSVAIIRGDMTTHVIDTVGFIAVPFAGRGGRVVNNPDGSVTMIANAGNPIPIADDWAVVSDGSVAFVRGQDYHIDWVNADGTRSSTPKIAHDWHRLSDSEKSVILDSAKRYMDSLARASAARQAKADSINAAGGRAGARRQTTVYMWPDVSDLPDYRPVISQGQGGIVKADAENNLWIRQGGSNGYLQGTASPIVYDVVNRQGVLVDRVQLPPSLSLAGFGPGVVYLTSREGWGTVIVKYRIH